MKNKIKISIIFILTCFVLFLINLLISDTFFKNYYISDNSKIKIPKYSFNIIEYKNTVLYPTECCDSTIELKSLRSKSYLYKFIKDYIENLPTCYDESYFYDSKYNITYNKYAIEKKGIYYKMTISFQKGNSCENVYVLDDEWLDVVNSSKLISSTFDYKKLINMLKQSNRLDFNKRIPYVENNRYQTFLIYQKYGYTLYFNVYSENVVGVTRIDANEVSKYALYDIKTDAESFLDSL